jgi:predicted RNA-binding Zn-ribbon protein involved in translation (DUF1610 family)
MYRVKVTCRHCGNIVLARIAENNTCPNCGKQFILKVKYDCPGCGQSHFVSKKDTECPSCHKKFKLKERTECPNPECKEDIWVSIGENKCNKCNCEFTLKEGGIIEQHQS